MVMPPSMSYNSLDGIDCSSPGAQVKPATDDKVKVRVYGLFSPYSSLQAGMEKLFPATKPIFSMINAFIQAMLGFFYPVYSLLVSPIYLFKTDVLPEKSLGIKSHQASSSIRGSPSYDELQPLGYVGEEEEPSCLTYA